MRRRIALGILAAVIAAVGAVWWNRAELKRQAYGEGPERDAWQQPERVLEALVIQPGQRIADIGAGGGYFTFRFARAVGPAGKVYAVDIDPDMTKLVERMAREQGHANVQTILAEPHDPHLPEEVDLIFVANTYHHIHNRTDYFRRVRVRLRPGGRLAIVEYSGKENWFARTFGHSTGADAIRAELVAAGYRLVQQYDFLSQQHFLIFGASDLPRTP